MNLSTRRIKLVAMGWEVLRAGKTTRSDSGSEIKIKIKIEIEIKIKIKIKIRRVYVCAVLYDCWVCGTSVHVCLHMCLYTGVIGY